MRLRSIAAGVAAALMLARYSGSGECRDGHQAHAPENQGGGNIDDHQNGAEAAPISVRIIEDQNEAARREARAQRGEQREDSGLDAQEKSARAATRAAAFSALQTFFGLLSIGLLFWTLWYTRKTANAARASADQAEAALSHSVISAQAAARSADAAEGVLAFSKEQHQLTNRAFCIIVGLAAEVTPFASVRETPTGTVREGVFLVLVPTLTNIGRTAARDVMSQWHQTYTPKGQLPEWPAAVFDEGNQAVMPPALQWTLDPIFIDEGQVSDLLRGGNDLFVRVQARYRTQFSETLMRTNQVFKVKPRADLQTMLRQGKSLITTTLVGESILD